MESSLQMVEEPRFGFEMSQKHREIHDSSSIFKWYSLKQAKIKKEEASQPQQDSAFDYK